MQDLIGRRGETLFFVRITEFCRRNKPLFRPQFLGEKWPSVDFLVELMDCGTELTPFFFVQVKTTRQGYTRDHRLPVKVSVREARRLASLPSPAYLVGINERDEEAYIISAKGSHAGGISSLSTQFPLTKENQISLWREVRDVWRAAGPIQFPSRFTDPGWR